MNSFPLKKGQTYKQLPNGEMVVVDSEETPTEVEPEVNPPAAEATPEPEEANSERAAKILEQIQNRVEAATAKFKEAEPVKPKATEEDRYNFIKALIANKSFKKEYSLLNGQLKVTFRTITTSEAEAVTEAIVIQSERVPYSNLIAMSAAHMKYSLSCAITEIVTKTEDGIKIKQFESPLTKYSNEPRKDTYYIKEEGQLKAKTGMLNASPGQKIIWASVENFSDIQTPIYNMLFGCFQKFDALITELVNDSSNPDFFLNGADGL
jgi:hypothetical protein